MFPFAEAETVTNCSSFAVIWRLKSFTFLQRSPLASDFTCTVTEFTGVSVTIPHSSVPSRENFSVTIKVMICLILSPENSLYWYADLARSFCYVDTNSVGTNVLGIRFAKHGLSIASHILTECNPTHIFCTPISREWWLCAYDLACRTCILLTHFQRLG